MDGGDTVRIGRSVELIVPDDGAVEVQTSGWEDDCDGRFRDHDTDIRLWDASVADLRCELDGNDNLGILERRFAATDNFGIGTHNDASARNGDADTRGDFNLRYHVDLIQRFPANPGNVVR